MKKQMILDQTGTIPATLESFFVYLHEYPYNVVDLGHIFQTKFASFKECVKKQDKLKALHKLIDFFVLDQCQFVENFFPFFDSKASIVQRMTPG